MEMGNFQTGGAAQRVAVVRRNSVPEVDFAPPGAARSGPFSGESPPIFSVRARIFVANNKACRRLAGWLLALKPAVR
jgi:hypothetical protein